MSVEKLKPNTWYWVKGMSDEDWFPAMHDPKAAGGWTNTDTWEDVEGEITEWQEIRSPCKSNKELISRLRAELNLTELDATDQALLDKTKGTFTRWRVEFGMAKSELKRAVLETINKWR